MPRKRHVSRNFITREEAEAKLVMPRKRHVSRNTTAYGIRFCTVSHASQEACE